MSFLLVTLCSTFIDGRCGATLSRGSPSFKNTNITESKVAVMVNQVKY